MTIFSPCIQADLTELMVIENDCHSHPWSENTFKSCLAERYFSYHLTVDNQIVGFYVGEHVAGEATLMDICVSPSFQGKGYGKTLLKHFIEQAYKLDNTKCWLEVRAKNFTAQMLYIAQGFTEISRRTGYYPSSSADGGYEDAIVMCLEKTERNLCNNSNGLSKKRANRSGYKKKNKK